MFEENSCPSSNIIARFGGVVGSYAWFFLFAVGLRLGGASGFFCPDLAWLVWVFAARKEKRLTFLERECTGRTYHWHELPLCWLPGSADQTGIAIEVWYHNSNSVTVELLRNFFLLARQGTRKGRITHFVLEKHLAWKWFLLQAKKSVSNVHCKCMQVAPERKNKVFEYWSGKTGRSSFYEYKDPI